MYRESPITSESIVCWSETQVATEVDREVVLMNVGRGRCYGLGESGSAVWRRLRSPIRVDDLCGELMLEYGAVAGRGPAKGARRAIGAAYESAGASS